jgi:branched-chain amino acid transport system substrate-binding protein
VFSVAIGLRVEAERLGAILGRQYKVVGVLHESTGYGATGADLVRRQIAAVSREVRVVVEPYNQRAADMGGQLGRLKAAGAEAVLVIGLGADSATIRKGMARLGFEVPFYGSAGSITAPYFEGAGELAVGTHALTAMTFGMRPLPERVQAFLALYREKYGTDRWYGADPENPRVSMSTSVGSGYDCVHVLLDAMTRAGSVEKGAVMAALEQTRDLPGVSVARISFSAQEHRALKPEDLGFYEVVRRGERVVLQLQRE